MTTRYVAAAAFAIATGWSVLAHQHPTLPSRLSDREFWKLSQEMSEPGGFFQSDNLVSNETGFQKVLPELTDRHAPGGVYLGVGPEQNYTYIAALRPAVVFIVDVRRENRDLHLMYKALFELSSNRLEFVSMLFSRAIPNGLTKDSTAAEIFGAFATAPHDGDLERTTANRITWQLTGFHRLGLSQAEVDTIRATHATFAGYGLNMSYSARRGSTGPGNVMRVTYPTLMVATDAQDLPSSFLSSEARFGVVKDLHIRNLIIPVVGNFAGPKALRAVGDWLRARQVIVAAFYLSNVEDYLRQPSLLTPFCQNAAALPIDDKSNFIRSGRGMPVSAAIGTQPSVQQGFFTVTLSDRQKLEISAPQVQRFVISSSQGGVSTNRLGLIRAETTACLATR